MHEYQKTPVIQRMQWGVVAWVRMLPQRHVVPLAIPLRRARAAAP